MSGNPDAIAAACYEISNGSIKRARNIISSKYPFVPLVNPGRKYSNDQKIMIYLRDGFIDRYSGDRLVFPGALRLLSCEMPDVFPFHSNWKISECHLAYWQLFPSIDHIVPVSRGGADEEANWVSTSQLRNGAKSNWLLEELGWVLHEPGRLDEWDGMMSWYITHIDQNQTFLADSYLSAWYRAAKRMLDTYNATHTKA